MPARKAASHRYRLGILFATLFCCAFDGVTAESDSVRGIRADLTGLRISDSAAPTVLYVRPGAPDISNYPRFIIDPVIVEYADPELPEVSYEDASRLAREFQDRLVYEFLEAGLTLTTRSEPDTLRLSFLITGLKSSKPESQTDLATGRALSVSKVTVEAVFKDASSGRVNAVARVTTEGASSFTSGQGSDWSDIEATLDRWATGIVERIIAWRGPN